MTFRTIFHDTTWKLLRLVGVLIAIGIFLIFVDTYIIPKLFVAEIHFVSSILQELSISFMIAGIIILTVDVGFRQELLTDIQDIFGSTQDHVFFDKTVSSRHEFIEEIVEDVKKSVRRDKIDTAGVIEGTFFTGTPGHELIKNKIIEGVNFRVIILHPKSSLLLCIQNQSKYYGTPNLTGSVNTTITGVINQLVDEFKTGRSSVRGSLEIRMHKDVLLSGYYYSGPALTIFSPYLAHKRGELCPAFSTTDRQYCDEMKRHFAAMWQQSEENVLAKVSKTEFVNNTTTVST